MPVQHLRLRARCCQRAGRAACHFAISFAIAFKAGFSILNAPENLGFAGKPHDAVSSFLPQLHRKEAMLSSMCSISEGYEDDLCQDAIVTFSLADADRVGLGIVTAQKTIAPLVLIAQDPALRLFIPDDREDEHPLDSVLSIIDRDSLVEVRMPLADHHQAHGDMCWWLPDSIDLEGVYVKFDPDKFIDPH
eukprot:TRINITY_DN14742_c0_g2_i2.p1 TRINITY_DN14742_c0_g2~~TRINITY_DN14742_c0_g2_i2.p1  ORF type:complete len:191 (+),score=32.88 TRINITY_DN14742_c0_g2_i2:237-809(+)